MKIFSLAALVALSLFGCSSEQEEPVASSSAALEQYGVTFDSVSDVAGYRLRTINPCSSAVTKWDPRFFVGDAPDATPALTVEDPCNGGHAAAWSPLPHLAEEMRTNVVLSISFYDDLDPDGGQAMAFADTADIASPDLKYLMVYVPRAEQV